MLSPADRAICDRDPDLPGLALVLDATELGRATGLGLLTPAYLCYKPRTSCAGGFFTADGAALAAHAYTPARYDQVRSRAEWREDPDVIFCDAECLAIVPARLDRDLRALRRVFDPERQSRLLRKLVGRSTGEGITGLSLLRYKPGRRLVARVDREDGACAALKVTSQASFTQAMIGATGAAALGGAPLLGVDAPRNILVTKWIHGALLCPATAVEIPERKMIARAGATLARFHQAGFRPPQRMSERRDADALAEIVAALGALDRRLGKTAARTAADLVNELQTLTYERTLIHGDFSADQIVIRKGKAVILDWDHAAQGDPAMDFGSFLARLDAQVIEGTCSRDVATDIGDGLKAGYAEAAHAVPKGIAIRQAQGLLMLATEGFRNRHPQWLERTEALLERTAELLDQSRKRRTDNALPLLDKALEAKSAHMALAGVLGVAPVNITLAPPMLVRHKRGRRAMVAYELESGRLNAGPIHLLGKIRAKGLDRRTPQVHDALRQAGLDGSTGVGVPPVAGTVAAFDMWLQVRIPGTLLAGLLDPDGPLDPFRRTGAALAPLHAAPAAADRGWSMADEADVLDRALTRAAAARPADSDACSAIARAAREQLAALAPVEPCGIHRDFYFDQVMVEADCIWLLDLDLFARGDPAIDLGNFLAHLDEYGLRRHSNANALSRQCSAFLSGYEAILPLPSARRLGLLRTVSLARHIDISRRFADRQQTTDWLIANAFSALARQPQHEGSEP